MSKGASTSGPTIALKLPTSDLQTVSKHHFAALGLDFAASAEPLGYFRSLALTLDRDTNKEPTVRAPPEDAEQTRG